MGNFQGTVIIVGRRNDLRDVFIAAVVQLQFTDTDIVNNENVNGDDVVGTKSVAVANPGNFQFRWSIVHNLNAAIRFR